MSKSSDLPKLDYKNFYITRDKIHNFAIVLGKIREQLSPVQRDYWHISLRVKPQGLTTTPINTENGQEFEIVLNLIKHKIEIINGNKIFLSENLVTLSVPRLIKLILAELKKMGIEIDLKIKNLNREDLGEYNLVQAENLWHAYYFVYNVFSEFRKELDFELSPIQIWPHHFDISFSLYTGNKVKDPKNPEIENMEQITYGFLTGDTTINEPYFYVISYPNIKNLSDNKLDNDAFWYDEDWQGAILKYQDLYSSPNFNRKLLSFLNQTKEIFMKELTKD